MAGIECSVTGSSESTFVVRDERGDRIGTITRIPSSRPLLRPTWRIDQVTKERVLEWRAGGEIAMLSEGVTSVTVKADWLDRRLAFAYALVAG